MLQFGSTTGFLIGHNAWDDAATTVVRKSRRWRSTPLQSWSRPKGFNRLPPGKWRAQIGYTVGTLYHVFRNFDDLVIHLNAQTIDEMAALIQQQTRKKRNPEVQIRAMAEFYVQYATNHPDRWRLVFEHQAPRGLPTPELMKQRRDVMFELVAENLARSRRTVFPTKWRTRRPHCGVGYTASASWR